MKRRRLRRGREKTRQHVADRRGRHPRDSHVGQLKTRAGAADFDDEIGRLERDPSRQRTGFGRVGRRHRHRADDPSRLDAVRRRRLEPSNRVDDRLTGGLVAGAAEDDEAPLCRCRIERSSVLDRQNRFFGFCDAGRADDLRLAGKSGERIELRLKGRGGEDRAKQNDHDAEDGRTTCSTAFPAPYSALDAPPGSENRRGPFPDPD